METDTVTEHVEFICPHCEHRWREDYTVRHHRSGAMTRSYYYHRGRLTLSPYDPAGAPTCPGCSRVQVTGRLAATSAGDRFADQGTEWRPSRRR